MTKRVLEEERDEARHALGGPGVSGLFEAALFLGLAVACAQALGAPWPIVAFFGVVETVVVVALLRARRTIRRWRDQERERLMLVEAERIGSAIEPTVMDVFSRVARRELTPEEGARILHK
mgnify:FL=1